MRAAIAGDLFGDVAQPLHIGRYVIREALGEGGMGVVYSAWDPTLARAVALKLLSREVSRDEKRRLRMVREAQALAKLSHPNVVHVYEVGEHDEEVFVAMELVDGPSMKDWLNRSRPSLAEISEVFLQAGRGLSAAHEVGLVHRDFKPSNVIVGSDGRTRVVDFGLASGGGSGTDSVQPIPAPTSGEKLTRTGAVLGTPAYMAPEQLRGEPPDARADQFSFCVALFEAVAGSRPFKFIDLRDSPDSASIIGWERIPRRWRAPLRRGLSTKPGERWPRLDDLLRALQPTGRIRTTAPWVGLLAVATAAWVPWSSKQAPCADLPATPGHWDDARATALADAFSSTGAPFAAEVWATTRAELDAFSTSWSESRARACTGEIDPAYLECLDRASAAFESVLLETARVDGTSILAAHRLPALLANPRVCAANPSEGFDGELEAAALSDLTAVRTKVTLDEHEAALESTEKLLGDPRFTGSDAIAELHELRARSLAALARHEEASQAFGRSLASATTTSHRARRHVAWLRYLLEMDREQSALDALTTLDALVPDEAPAGLRARLLELRGEADTRLDGGARLELLREAEELYARSGETLEASRARMARAGLLSDADSEESRHMAEELYRAELAYRRRALGDRHPETAAAQFNLAVAMSERGDDWPGVLERLRKAEAVEAETLPPNSTSRARTRLKIAEALINLGRADEAEGVLDSAWSVLENVPMDHSDHVAARTLLARFAEASGEFDEALEHSRILAGLTPDDAFVQQNIAFFSVHLGDAKSAKRALARARALILAYDFDEPTLELLELYFRAIDAQIAHLDGRPDDALAAIDEIEGGAAAYTVPQGRPDLQGQLQKLQPELDDLRARITAEQSPEPQ